MIDEEKFKKWKEKRDKPHQYNKEESKRRGKERAEEMTRELKEGKQDLWIHKVPKWGLKVRRFK